MLLDQIRNFQLFLELSKSFQMPLKTFKTFQILSGIVQKLFKNLEASEPIPDVFKSSELFKILFKRFLYH